MTSGSDADAPDRPRNGPRLCMSLSTALVGGIALVIVAAVGSVLTIGVIGAGRNTVALLLDRADLGLNLLETEVAAQLQPVERGTGTVAALIADATLTPARPDELRAVSEAMLRDVPQLDSLISIVDGFAPLGVRNAAGGPVPIGDLSRDDPRILRALGVARTATGPTWYAPTWISEIEATVLSLLVPITVGGDFTGMVAGTVSLARLSEALAAVGAGDARRAMILYGDGHVLAHPALHAVDAAAVAGRDPPLHRLGDVDADAQAAIDDDRIDDDAERAEREAGRAAFMAAIDRPQMAAVRAYSNEDWTLLVRDLPGYAGAPLQLAVLSSTAVAWQELQRVGYMAAAGVAILLAAVLAGTLIGRRVTRRVRALSTAAEHLRTLDVDAVEELPPSRFRELDSAARSINSLTAAMKWFETYVPKTLVESLMRQGAAFALSSSKREMTVMFTDIRGFSGTAEDMAPDAVAEMLNGHFDLVAGCIEATGGTVDKFMGDSVMAFWGAPESLPDHAARAVGAARAIIAALDTDNAGRRSAGLPLLHVGIGIHTGAVIVGNIGSRNRVNYTVVGDPVNIASRLEGLAKSLAPADASIVVMSGATRSAAGDPADADAIGSHTVRGRRAAIEVYRLAGGTSAA